MLVVGTEVGLGFGVAVGAFVAVAFAVVVVLPEVLVGLAAHAANIRAPHNSATWGMNSRLVFIALSSLIAIASFRLPGWQVRKHCHTRAGLNPQR
jgi:hypothetical protein